jgi:hypothetical protein
MRLDRKARRLVVGVTVVALLAIPASFVFATDRFTDVPSGAFYHSSVTAISNAGITAGCTSTKYCPNSGVTRGQMAVFLDKLGGLSAPGGVPNPVMDALSDQGTKVDRFFRTVAMSGAGSSDCAPASTLAFPANFGQYALVFKLYQTPAAINPALVNVQLRDADDPSPDEYEICFQTTNGASLPDGLYKLFGTQMTFIGQRRFG